MNTSIPYVMRDMNKSNIDNIMQFDLTWRQKKSSKSLHLAIIGGLTFVWMLAQAL
ncbi:MAG: hypothetical protein HKP55_03625 [Gammaproteobacteria bacterium]|nr:hypothetical protein [Gammaproteobacteria bacterium]NNJ90745.1 hypothetical protein [Gammaproteobacteria bacterium]